MNEEFDSQLNSTHPRLLSVPFGTIFSEQNIFVSDLEMGNTTTFSTTAHGDEEYTQIVSIFGFSALVLIAIFAWLFSRHCCFHEKPTGPGEVRRSRPQQFNFLGAQVIRRLGSNNPVAATRTEDPPPSYEDLFPTVVVVQDVPPYVPAPEPDASDVKTDPNKGNRTESKDVP